MPLVRALTMGDIESYYNEGARRLGKDVQEKDYGKEEHGHVHIMIQQQESTCTDYLVLERIFFQIHSQELSRNLGHLQIQEKF